MNMVYVIYSCLPSHVAWPAYSFLLHACDTKLTNTSTIHKTVSSSHWCTDLASNGCADAYSLCHKSVNLGTHTNSNRCAERADFSPKLKFPRCLKLWRELNSLPGIPHQPLGGLQCHVLFPLLAKGRNSKTFLSPFPPLVTAQELPTWLQDHQLK